MSCIFVFYSNIEQCCQPAKNVTEYQKSGHILIPRKIYGTSQVSTKDAVSGVRPQTDRHVFLSECRKQILNIGSQISKQKKTKKERKMKCKHK